MKKQETYYDLLKLDPRATITDIVAAYHAARGAFSKDSLAVYSLFSQEEAAGELKRLEEAYLTLSNLDRKREYDKQLTATPEAAVRRSPAPAPEVSFKTTDSTQPQGPISGPWLKSVREQRGMSLEDVARLTKIPVRFLKGIETQDPKNLPVRVYLQGFVNNLGKLYRLDPGPTTHAYLQNLDKPAA